MTQSDKNDFSIDLRAQITHFQGRYYINLSNNNFHMADECLKIIKLYEDTITELKASNV